MATLTPHATGPGAASVRDVKGLNPRTTKIATGTFDFDSSYPTGGEATTGISDLFAEVLYVNLSPKSGYTFEYDYTNNKILAYYADYDAVADGALIQVPNTTNLSTVTGVRWVAFGY